MGEGRAVATVDAEIAPTATRHLADLTVPRGGFTDNTPLVGENALPAIIAELEAALQPTTPERGANWARFLIGCYPTFKAHDAAVYVRAISSLFAETPEDLCKVGVDRASRMFKYPPTRAEVHEVLEGLRQERRGQLYAAKAMVREHARRREEVERAELIAFQKARWREEHGDRSPLEVVREKISAGK